MNKITIEKNSEAKLVIKKSKFLSFSFFVKDKEEVLDIVRRHKEKYKDATHNCFGYIIKLNMEEGFSDDGEPSKTAGFPILEYLKNNNYENTLVIVTRYFGGTLLGTGGLVSAYSDSAEEVLNISGKCLVGDGYIFKLNVDYSFSEIIKNMFENEKIYVENIVYGEDVEFTLQIFEDELEYVKQKLLNILQIDESDLKYNIEKSLVKKQ